MHVYLYRYVYNQVTACFSGNSNLPLELKKIPFYPQQVKRLELQDNELSTIPECLLCLPNLNILNLSNNKLTSLPKLSEWSSSLTELNLSQNKLSNIPGDPKAMKLRNLYLSGNEFTVVPPCITNFVNLLALDLSDNKGIQVLPDDMGCLEKLCVLELKGIKLKEPPAQFLKTTQDCIQYLRNKLYKAKPFYSMKLMLMGNGNRGKTTLVARLQGKECGNVATVGVEITEWECSEGPKTFHFNIWDFAGQEEYYATHQCFLSDCSIYLIFFNLMDGQSALTEIEPWLINIALRAQSSCVHIVGTHLDEVPQDLRSSIDILLEKILQKANLYIRNIDVHAVSLMNQLENLEKLKNSIYKSASEYKFNGKALMGQEVPLSYHKLYSHFKKEVAIDVRQGKRQPIMLAGEYMDEVNKFCDITDDKELATVTRFLVNAGALLHYDDRSYNLHELYFVDPSWLCDMMSAIVAVKHKNPYIKDGILPIEKIPLLLRDERFHLKYFAQYLTLLDSFEIAFAIDPRSILIPSLLPDTRPEGIDNLVTGSELVHTRCILFEGSTTPRGLWSRLISRIMHSVSQIKYIVSKEVSIPSDNEVIASFLSGIPQHPQPAESLNIDISQVRLEFWKNGIYYKDPDVIFLVESLKSSRQLDLINKEGILILTSSTKTGRSLYGQLIDMVVVLCNNLLSNHFNCTQVVLCSTCLQTHSNPCSILDVEQIRLLGTNGQNTITCEQGHMLALSDIIPDQLLRDLDPRFLLKSSDINNKTELLGRGGEASVYAGTYQGLPVAIKKYSEGSQLDSIKFSELRKEVLMLQKLYHPCLVNLIGVCIHPTMDVVLERAPLGSLHECLINKQQSVHRVVMHRIAAQVAAALRAIHNMGIIYRDLKASNILLWSLDPESLCHCKLTDFGTAIEQAPIGTRARTEGTRGFTAPEVLGRDGNCFIYTHSCDIFSLAMVLYQMIARRDPFHDCKDGLGRNAAVVKGERPKLQDVPQAQTAYFYLTRLMKLCWQEVPDHRPTTTEIVIKASLSSTQTIMSVLPVQNGLELQPSCIVSQAELSKAGMTCESNEIWICSTDKDGGTEVVIYPILTMKSRMHFTIPSTTECISVCGDHVWTSVKSGNRHSIIQMFNICTGILVNEILMLDIVCCIASSDRYVYCGTSEGLCIKFPQDVKLLKSDSQHAVTNKISESFVDGIVITSNSLWVSHTKYIHLLDLESLDELHVVTNAKVKKSETFSRQHHYDLPKRSASNVRGEKINRKPSIGTMRLSSDGMTIWSCCLQHSSTISAWSVSNKCHMFDIGIETHMATIAQIPVKQMVVTAMVTVLDTLWVGTQSGHIIVFCDETAVMWFQPYCMCICFLASITCEPQKAIVVSGAKGFLPLLDSQLEGEGNQTNQGTVIVWEGYPSNVCRQLHLIQSESSTFLDSHDAVRELIQKGSFRDGTHLLNPIHDAATSK